MASAGPGPVLPRLLEPSNSVAAPLNRPTTQAFSVIIPTFNEAAYVAQAIHSARSNHVGEIIIVDGGSTDATCRIAEQWEARVLQTRRNRAAQMNYGALHARGEWLCFLHADCHLSAKALSRAARYVNRPGVAAACFCQRHWPASWHFRWLDAGANLRTRCLGLAYGDQGLIVRRDIFLEIGGFPEIPIFEDAAFCRKLLRFGRLILLPATIYVSPRRWLARSFWSVTINNWVLFAAWQAGLSPTILARFRRPFYTSRHAASGEEIAPFNT